MRMEDTEELVGQEEELVCQNRAELRKRRRRNRTISNAILGFGCFIILVLVVYLAGVAYVWIAGEVEEGGIVSVQGDLNEEPADAESSKDGVPEYTAGELDQVREEAHMEGRQEILNVMKDVLSSGEVSVVEMLRPYYENEMVVVSQGKFYFVPILENLKKNPYSNDNLKILESGEYQYVEDGKVTSHKGIDVSKFQGKIDWEAVAADGVEFAFIRVGSRGYGKEGRLIEDARFDENVKGAQKAGIKVGVYFYTQALDEEELLEEADYVLKKLEPYKIECPVVYDVELVSGADGRMNSLSAGERTDLTLLFCRTIEEAGYKPMIYYNLEMAALKLELEALEEYDKWFAYYNPEFYFPYDYQIWQYTHNGRVNGIDGEVDLNISFSPFWE